MAKGKRIGEALRDARLAAGLSARDVSRLTGMATGAISQIESGTKRADPGFGTVLKLARAIGISMEDLALATEGKPSGPAKGDGGVTTRALAAVTKAQADVAKASRSLEGAAKALEPTKRAKR